MEVTLKTSQSTLIFVVLSVILFSFAGCAITGKNSAIVSHPGSEIRIYEVFGMDCPACAGGLDKLVEKNSVVVESLADWKAKKLTVVVKQGEKLQDEDIFKAIEESNFTPGKRIK